MPCDLRFSLARALTFRTLYGRWHSPTVLPRADMMLAAPPTAHPQCAANRTAEAGSDTWEWKPWPGSETHVEKAGRWWPSDELPPVTTSPDASSRLPTPPQIIRMGYGRLELWA